MEDARGKARECVGGERLHAYASCMPWANNSYEVSPVSRDMHGTESCYATTFRKFHAILNHANYAARPAQGEREREREFGSGDSTGFLFPERAAIRVTGRLMRKVCLDLSLRPAIFTPEDLLGNV